MSEYHAEVLWTREDADFLDNRYSRRHRWRFDGGAEVAGSSSPQVIPLPMSDAGAIDPEEAFVASLSSCHMLWFLSIAAKHRFRVDRYRDIASGTMQKNAKGKMFIAEVILRPEVSFAGSPQPSRKQFEQMHDLAHEECFIANSVRTEVRCEAVLVGE